MIRIQGEQFKKTCISNFDAADKAKLEACTSIKCESCEAGHFRSGTAANNAPCEICPVNEYSGGMCQTFTLIELAYKIRYISIVLYCLY